MAADGLMAVVEVEAACKRAAFFRVLLFVISLVS